MKYEIYDRHNPRLRGLRFTTRERAERELALAIPKERWDIREVGKKQ